MRFSYASCFLSLTLAASVALAEESSATTAAPAPALIPATPVAGWDVVPHQTLTKPMRVGVVAFHLQPVTVAFTIVVPGATNPITTVEAPAPTLNDATQVWEYGCDIDPATIPDGPFEVKARAFVTAQRDIGTELTALPLYANTKGTLPVGKEVVVDATQGDDAQPGNAEKPLRTLKAGIAAAGVGGRVLLRAGSYSFNSLGGGKRDHWTTVAAVPGVAREAVELVTPARPGVDKLHFVGVSFVIDPATKGFNSMIAGDQGHTAMWFDDCRFWCKKGREWRVDLSVNGLVTYITGGETMDLNNAPSAQLMRGHRVRRIASDAFSGVRIAINCTVDEIDRGATEAHPDFCQSTVGKPDQTNSFILYNCRGLRCAAQGFFGNNLRNSAFVNCLFVKYPADLQTGSQYTGIMQNVLFLHLTLPDQRWLWRGKGIGQTRDVAFVNGIVPSMNALDADWSSGIRVDHTHVQNGAAKPADAAGTSGEFGFANTAAGDYRLRPDSSSAGTGLPLACVPADIDGKPWPANKPNRGCLRSSE